MLHSTHYNNILVVSMNNDKCIPKRCSCMNFIATEPPDLLRYYKKLVENDLFLIKMCVYVFSLQVNLKT